MSDEQDKLIPIDYTHREFTSIKKDLVNLAEYLYPNVIQDFSEGSVASMLLDAVAYVGDQLSFYLDYNVNESFLDTAYEYNNIVRHGKILGYRNKGRTTTSGELSFFVLVPASSTGLGPDRNYLPLLKQGSLFGGTNGTSYILTEDVSFANPSNTVVVGQVNERTGAPTSYAVRARGAAVAGYFGSQSIRIGNYTPYRSIVLGDTNITEILTLHDSSGNEYFEVEYLSQDMIFREVSNKDYKESNVPSILKPYLVSRKFAVSRLSGGRTVLEFAAGKADEPVVIATPQEVAVEVFGKDYVSDTTFDPTRLSKSTTYGISPYNTVLTVTYRSVSANNRNAGANTITMVTNANWEFTNETQLSAAKILDVKKSLELTNPLPFTGRVTSPTSTDLKQRVYDTFPTQNRAVTQSDYESLCYRMPGKFGNIKRVSAQRDPNSLRRNINLYVISEDEFGKLIVTNNVIKNNLKTWLEQYRMMNDTIDILDPYVINFGIEYGIRVKSGADKYTAIRVCNEVLGTLYTKTANFIGEPLYISDMYARLKEVPLVLDVTHVKIINRSGVGYASTLIDINNNLSPDGSQLVTPKNAILELKYPSKDIIGKII